MGIEIILFSLLYLPASEELNIAFSCGLKKKKRKETPGILNCGRTWRLCWKKEFLDQSIFVFSHIRVCLIISVNVGKQQIQYCVDDIKGVLTKWEEKN